MLQLIKTCLDQAVKTQKMSSTDFAQVKKIEQKTRIWLVSHMLFLTPAKLSYVWFRQSKHGNHKLILYSVLWYLNPQIRDGHTSKASVFFSMC